MKQWILGIGFLLVAVSSWGDGDALYRQGLAAYQVNPEKACTLFVEAAEAGSVSAMAGAGHCFETGTGTAIDYGKAIEWYEQGIRQNSLKACEGLARIYASCPDPEFHDGPKAVKFATPVARKKPRDPNALNLLATAYLRDMRPAEAKKTGSKAVKYAGSIEQARELKKKLPAFERGQPEPAVATEEWIMNAAQKDVEWAVVKLARMAADPEGSIYNPQLAILMCNKGIKMGRVELYLEMGWVHFNENRFKEANDSFRKGAMSYNGFRKKRPVEFRYYAYLLKSVDQVFEMAGKLRTGYTVEQSYTATETRTGYDAYGNSYSYDVQVSRTRDFKYPANPEASRFLYRIAHKKGHPEAEKQMDLVKDGSVYQHVGKISGTQNEFNQMIAEARKYEKGTGVVKDLNKALEFYLKAYELNKKSYSAPWNIGDLYLRIHKPKREVDQAIFWLEKAVSLGGVDAGWRLASMYATDKDPAVRDGKKAVKYAKTYADYKMKRYEENKNENKVKPFGSYETLAQAYARNGQFKEAEKTMLLTIEMMRETTFYDKYINTYKKQLMLFRNNQAWPPD